MVVAVRGNRSIDNLESTVSPVAKSKGLRCVVGVAFLAGDGGSPTNARSSLVASIFGDGTNFASDILWPSTWVVSSDVLVWVGAEFVNARLEVDVALVWHPPWAADNTMSALWHTYHSLICCLILAAMVDHMLPCCQFMSGRKTEIVSIKEILAMLTYTFCILSGDVDHQKQGEWILRGSEDVLWTFPTAFVTCNVIQNLEEQNIVSVY